MTDLHLKNSSALIPCAISFDKVLTLKFFDGLCQCGDRCGGGFKFLKRAFIAVIQKSHLPYRSLDKCMLFNILCSRGLFRFLF